MPVSDRPAPLTHGILLYRQILDRLAEDIDRGILAPGDRLPTTAILAERFGVTIKTAQQALDGLRQRGLLERQRGQGTFVSPRVRARTLGVVFGRNVLADPDCSFYQLLLARLQVVAEEQGWDLRCHFFPLAARDQDRIAACVDAEAHAGSIRALVALCCGSGSPLRHWLETACPVPWVRLSSQLDRARFAAIGLRYLLGRGYRRIAYLPPDQLDAAAAEAEALHATAIAAGAFPPELLPAGAAERHGYAVMRALLTRPPMQRPQALFIGDDNTCRGAIYALLEAGLSTPRDLGILTHANRGMEPFFPLPLTRLEYDPDAIARRLVGELATRLAGGRTDAAEPLLPILVPGRTCGETP